MTDATYDFPWGLAKYGRNSWKTGRKPDYVFILESENRPNFDAVQSVRVFDAIDTVIAG